MSGRPRILLTADHYRPGYRAGGPIRTLGNLVDRLGGEYRFSIVTRHHDLADSTPYASVPADQWVESDGPCRVWYASPATVGRRLLAQIARETPHDLIYLNSLWSPGFTVPVLWLRRTGALPRRPVVLAPRGELGESALAIKSVRKRLFLAGARALGFYRGVTWQVTGDHEAARVRAMFGRDARVMNAPNPPPLARSEAGNAGKRPGALRLLLLGRMSPMKNVTGALEMLAGLRGEVALTLCGPKEEPGYWAACEKLMAALPGNVTVEVLGAVEPNRLPEIMAEHHMLLLPTLGENFGHAILECLLAGLPVLISDRTRWRELEVASAGWDLPLETPAAFTDVISRCLAMDDAAWGMLRDGARAYGAKHGGGEVADAAHRALFAAALAAEG